MSLKDRIKPSNNFSNPAPPYTVDEGAKPLDERPIEDMGKVGRRLSRGGFEEVGDVRGLTGGEVKGIGTKTIQQKDAVLEKADKLTRETTPEGLILEQQKYILELETRVRELENKIFQISLIIK